MRSGLLCHDAEDNRGNLSAGTAATPIVGVTRVVHGHLLRSWVRCCLPCTSATVRRHGREDAVRVVSKWCTFNQALCRPRATVAGRIVMGHRYMGCIVSGSRRTGRMGLSDHAHSAPVFRHPDVRRACPCPEARAWFEPGTARRDLRPALDVHRPGGTGTTQHQPAQPAEDRGGAEARSRGAGTGVAGAGEVGAGAGQV